jgi:anthranilate/para-aminobenzoate synthase component I
MAPRGAPRAGTPAPLLDPLAATLIDDAGSWVEPVSALAALQGARRAVLLLSGESDHPASRWSILAWDPVAEIRILPGVVEIERHATGAVRESLAGDPFVALRQLLPAGSPEPDNLPWSGGALGFLGYGLRHAIERLPRAASDPFGQPDGWFGVYADALLFDHHERRVLRVAVADPDVPPGESARRREAMRALLVAAARPQAAPGVLPPIRVTPATSRADYLAAIRIALQHIAAGDLYQVNLSHRLEARLRETPVDLFARRPFLPQVNKSKWTAFPGFQHGYASLAEALQSRRDLGTPKWTPDRRGQTSVRHTGDRRRLGRADVHQDQRPGPGKHHELCRERSVRLSAASGLFGLGQFHGSRDR